MTLALLLYPIPQLDLELGVVRLGLMMIPASPRNEHSSIVVDGLGASPDVELSQRTEASRMSEKSVL